MNKDIAIGFLFGVVLVLAGMLILTKSTTPAIAQTAMGSSSMLAVTGKEQGGNQDVLFVVDTAAKKVAVYKFYRGTLALQDVRNIKYDLMLDFLKRQKPTVKEIYRKVKK